MDESSKETLKESLGLLGSIENDFSDFAIDSDDEEDVPPPPPTSTASTASTMSTVPLSQPQSAPTSGISSNGSTQLKKQTVTANDDPLSVLLNSSASTPTSTPIPSIPITTAPTYSSNPPSQKMMTGTGSAINTAQPIYSTAATSMNNHNTATVTQSLSSTFSSFASKFQDAVSGTARTDAPVAGGNNYPRMVHGVSKNNVTAKYSERSVERTNSGLSSASNFINQSPSFNSLGSAPTVYNSSRVVDQKPQQVYQGGGSIGHDLDTTTKSSLITSAIGELLPGERVIVFLSNLLQIRDSSSPQTGVGSASFHSNHDNNDLVWCCVVTFYRLVLFSYHESECTNFAGANNGIANMSAQKDAMTDEMKSWMKSASVSSQYQHIQSSCLRQNGKKHYVLQMPLASVDRIEKTTEFGLNSSSSMTSQIGFSSAAASLMGGASSAVSSYNDSIGGAVASGTLVVYGKDNGRFIQFTAPSYADCMRVYESLNTYAFPGRRNLGYLFAFESRRAEVMASAKADDTDRQIVKNGAMRLGARATPRRYDAMIEFSRMVSGSSDGRVNMTCPWTPVLRANSTYNLCSSYPSIMFAPNTVDDAKPEGMRLLRDTASFRSGGRLQTLSWASRHDGASLWRSAQPKVGLQGNRSPADELFMKKIAESAALANSHAAVNGKMPPRPSLAFLKMLTGGINESDLMLENFRSRDAAAFNEKCMLKILDVRPKSSAIANRTAGYGYENTSHYKNTTLSFFGIGNIHAVRDSYKKISALCTSPATNDVQWMQLVEDTKWLSFIRLILSASWQAAFHIRYNRLPVLVHCSHGWDRTSQVCALAQIFLDPYYRTRVGFSCLVEKDFLALGHPLHTRCGHGEGKGGDQNGSGSSSSQSDEISPIFLQFVDCVFQIVNQYPDYFEFNTRYLLLLSEHIYSCRFGTLLCDTEREREVVASIRQRTYCLWEYLESCPGLVNNNFCQESILKESDVLDGEGCLLMPLPSLLRNVTLWVDRHCMHGAKPTLRSTPMLNDEDMIADKTRIQPLLGLNDMKDNSLKVAQQEASKWKKLAELREKEIFELNIRLKEAEEKKVNVE